MENGGRLHHAARWKSGDDTINRLSGQNKFSPEKRLKSNNLSGETCFHRTNTILDFIEDYLAATLPRKHWMVFSMRQQMVIGPTPPGTGVITEALGSTEAKSTSPQSFPFSSRSIPTSITAAPSLTMSPVTNFARPMATTRMSACLVISGRFFVFE